MAFFSPSAIPQKHHRLLCHQPRAASRQARVDFSLAWSFLDGFLGVGQEHKPDSPPPVRPSFPPFFPSPPALFTSYI